MPYAADELLPCVYRSSRPHEQAQKSVRLLRRAPRAAALASCCRLTDVLRCSAMADAADLSRVIALASKGWELMLKGHDARAAEKFSRAAEEAEQALLSPDSLVTCSVRQERLEALLRHVTSSAAAPADADKALREVCFRLLPSVMSVVERRRAAGTLLPGSCRAEEETYQMAMKQQQLELQGCTQASAARNAAVIAPYVGVETYLRVAVSVAYKLNAKGASECAEQKQACLFLSSALDLMTRPREFDRWLAGEPGLVLHLRALIPLVSDMDAPETKMLCAAWQRMLHSGVLCVRGIDKGIDASQQHHVHLRAVAAADLAAGRLQQCALAGCAARESHASQFKRCGACRTVCYCCREHQVEDWPSHKAACKANKAARRGARKAGAAADPAV